MTSRFRSEFVAAANWRDARVSGSMPPRPATCPSRSPSSTSQDRHKQPARPASSHSQNLPGAGSAMRYCDRFRDEVAGPSLVARSERDRGVNLRWFMPSFVGVPVVPVP
jgi:hypothetical protein